ncbi:MAG TPA: T9SS type A sorting domain-containing protein, partial [Bacteroidetes bacterium]|nr:T9SS type A sorting domain-containing protein [Bacteroidota bacterium]
NNMTIATELNENLEKFRLMNGRWYDGTPFTYGGIGYNPESTDTVDYVFPDEPTDPDGWSMYSQHIFKADRKVLAVSKRKQEPDFVFLPGASLQYDIAYSYHRSEGLNNLENVIYAKLRIPELQEMYSNGLKGYGKESCDCQCVWAGDTDHNGIVTYNDIVNVFKNYGQSGPKRNGPLAWTGLNVQNWQDNKYTDANPKYSDVNGDGVINMDDALLVRDFLGNTNLCYDHSPEEDFCDEGNEMNWEVDMQDTVIHLLNKINTKIKIPNKNDFMGLYYEIYFDPDIFTLKNIEDFMKWKNNPNNLFYSYYDEDKGTVYILQFNDQNKNLKLENNLNSILSLDYFVKRIPITYPTKYTDIKICNAKVFYDDGTEENLATQILHLRLPDKVEITGTNSIESDEVRVYPNPANSYIFIESKAKGISQVGLYNLNGKLLQTKSINTGLQKLEVNQLKPGIYFIKISSKEKVLVKKIEIF